MSTLSQFIGGDNILIGQIVPMKGSLNYFTNNNQEYLRTGFARAYSANYSTFKTRVPAGCFVAINKQNLTNPLSGTHTLISSSLIRMYYNGSKYVYIYTDTTGAGVYGYYESTNLTIWTTGVSTVATTTIYDTSYVSGTVIYAGYDTGSSAGIIRWRTSGNDNGSVATTIGTVKSVDCSPTLLVGINQGSSNATSIVTATVTAGVPGATTSRTGTGGAATFTMKQVFYSPIASAFFTIGNGPGGQSSLSMNKSTDGFTFTSVYDNDLTFNITAFGKEYVANSSSYSAISGVGKIRWTSNGTTWNTVDLTTLNLGVLLSSTTQYQIFYSATTNKFYIYAGVDATNRSTYLISTSDFTNWNTEFVLKDFATSDCRTFGLYGLNSKNLMFYIKNSTNDVYDVYDATAGLSAANPDYVGTTIGTFSSSIDGYVRIA